MTIEILDKTLQDDGVTPAIWAITIEITDGFDTYLSTATEPGSTAEGDLQTALEAREADLFAVAAAKGVVPDVTYGGVDIRKVLKAFALVVLDEVNILRGNDGLADRTVDQLRAAVKNKLKGLL